MPNEIDISIIDKVKKLLQVENDSPLELQQLLRRHRNSMHPDKFTDEFAQEEAKKKFVEIDTLLKELGSYIQREKLNKSPMELALYEPLYENSSLQTQLDNSIEENEELKRKIGSLKEQIEELKKELARKESDAIEKMQKDLIQIYKPSRNKIFSISFLLLLSGLIPVFTKIEEIATIIGKYSPFSADQINLTMFILFILVVLFSILNYIQYKVIKIKIAEITTPHFYEKLLGKIKEKEEFTENQIYNFIYGKQNRIKRILSYLGFKIFRADTINNLKDVFIHNLLCKQLIHISYAINLDRRFRIKQKPKYFYDYDY